TGSYNLRKGDWKEIIQNKDTVFFS
ncbi:MAG: hypothetical protein ACJAZ3_001984, partial [Sphingobacteriales bacterium]